MRFTKEAVVGLVFFLGLGLLVYVTMSLELVTPARGFPLKVTFERTEGLARGDTVWVDGVQSGSVQGIELGARGVLVTLRLRRAVDLRQDYRVSIQTSAVLGGKVVAIDRGSPDKPSLKVDPDRPLAGVSTRNFMDVIENLVSENRANITGILTDLRAVMAKVRAGEGTIGKLVTDDALYEQVRSASGRLDALLAGIQAGQGTVGRLWKEDTLHRKAETVLDHAAEIGKGLREGKGTLGKLLQSDELHVEAKATLTAARGAAEKLDKTAADVQVIVGDVREGKGTIGKLFREEVLYDDLQKTGENLRVISTDLKDGKGTLGKLLRDDLLYREARLVVSRIRETLEDLREQVPVSSFTGILFSAF